MSIIKIGGFGNWKQFGEIEENPDDNYDFEQNPERKSEIEVKNKWNSEIIGWMFETLRGVLYGGMKWIMTAYFVVY